MDSLLSYDSNEEDDDQSPSKEAALTKDQGTFNSLNSMKADDSKKVRRIFTLPIPSVARKSQVDDDDDDDDDDDKHIRVSNNKGSSLLAHVCDGMFLPSVGLILISFLVGSAPSTKIVWE